MESDRRSDSPLAAPLIWGDPLHTSDRDKFHCGSCLLQNSISTLDKTLWLF